MPRPFRFILAFSLVLPPMVCIESRIISSSKVGQRADMGLVCVAGSKGQKCCRLVIRNTLSMSVSCEG